MGYDLHMLKEPKYQISGGYWRAGGHGMGMLTTVMAKAGVLDFDHEGPAIGEIDAEPAGMDDEYAYYVLQCLDEDIELDDIDPPPTEPQLAVVRDHMARLNAWRGARGPDDKRVPAYKFRANDGCRVLPEECALIADALDAFLESDHGPLAAELRWDEGEHALIEWLEDWRDYNRVAAAHGGYRVS